MTRLTGGCRAGCCCCPWLWPAEKDEAELRVGGRGEDDDDDDEAAVGVVRPPAVGVVRPPRAPCVGVGARSDEAGDADRNDVLADVGGADCTCPDEGADRVDTPESVRPRKGAAAAPGCRPDPEADCGG